MWLHHCQCSAYCLIVEHALVDSALIIAIVFLMSPGFLLIVYYNIQVCYFVHLTCELNTPCTFFALVWSDGVWYRHISWGWQEIQFMGWIREFNQWDLYSLVLACLWSESSRGTDQWSKAMLHCCLEKVPWGRILLYCSHIIFMYNVHI